MENIEITYPGRASKGQAYIPVSRLHQVPENIQNYLEFSMFGELPAWGLYSRHAKSLTFKNITLKVEHSDFRPAFVFDDVSGLNLSQIQLKGTESLKQIILKDVNSQNFSVDESWIQTIEK